MADLRPPQLVNLTRDAEKSARDIDRNFSKIDDFLDELFSRAPWLDGTLLEGVDLAVGTTTQVEHKLGRAYRGWWVVKGSLNADYPGEGASLDSKSFLALTVTGAQTVSLWVF